MGIQRDPEIVSELFRVERAARKITAADFQRGDFALAVVGLHNDFFRGRISFDIHFAKFHAALFQE